jgi:site-specific recombinase XerD
MASLSEDRGKRGKTYRVSFTNAERQRKAVRLGAMPRKNAETIRAHIDRLESCLFDGSAPPPATAAWLAEVSDTLRKRIEAVGLVAAASEVWSPTLAELIAAFKRRPRWAELKDQTRRNSEKAYRKMIAHFGESQLIASLTDAAAEDFRTRLSQSKEQGGFGLARSTANRTCGIAWTLCRYAVRDRLIDRNPFDEVQRSMAGAVGDNRLISDEDSRKVLDQFPDTQWKLLFALARWGGLRMPSEPRLLTWDDVDRANERFLVTSPKTAHHEGKASRWVPIFPELAKLFQDRYDEAEPGDVLVLPMMATFADSTFASHLERAIKRAGLDRWPRLWHSLRSTRQTELEQRFPTYVVCQWMGNSESIARKHYLKVSDEHFTTAAQKAAQTPSATPRHDATSEQAKAENMQDSRGLTNGDAA